jgi:hypothetical protein
LETAVIYDFKSQWINTTLEKKLLLIAAFERRMKLPFCTLPKLALGASYLQQLWNVNAVGAFEGQSDQIAVVSPLKVTVTHEHCTQSEDHLIDRALVQSRLLGLATEKWYRAGPVQFPSAALLFRRWFGDVARATRFNQDANRGIIVSIAAIARRGTLARESPNHVFSARRMTRVPDSGEYGQSAGRSVDLSSH